MRRFGPGKHHKTRQRHPAGSIPAALAERQHNLAGRRGALEKLRQARAPVCLLRKLGASGGKFLAKLIKWYAAAIRAVMSPLDRLTPLTSEKKPPS
jgi:hypothetical protein